MRAWTGGWHCLAATCLALVACGRETGAPTAPVIESIHVGTALAANQEIARSLDDEPRSLDPQISTDVPAQRITDDLFEGLTYIDSSGNPGPGVATSWEHSTDGRLWTFHLRPEARWSNGAPVTAEDFVYAWRRLVDPATGAQYAQSLAPVRNALEITTRQLPPEALGVSAPDPHTLRIELAGPTPYLLALLAQQYLYPVYAPAVARYGDDWTRPDHFVGNGAFVLREHVIGTRLELDKSPTYWDAAHVVLQHVHYFVLPDRAVQTARFLAGDVQWTDSFAASQRDWLHERLGEQVVTSPYFGTYMLGFNFERPPFRDNAPLRRALVMAIDREPMVRALKHHMYEPAYSLLPPLPGYAPVAPDWRSLSDAQRHAAARAAYAAAGFSANHPLRVSIDTSAQGPEDRHFWEAVAANWHTVLGADVRVDEREFKILMQERVLHTLPLFLDAWIGDYPDPYTFLQNFYSGNGNNNGGYSSARFDQLIDAAGQDSEPAHRFELFRQAEQLLNEDVAYIPLYYYATRHLIKPYVRGWQSNVMDRNPSRYLYVLEHGGQ